MIHKVSVEAESRKQVLEMLLWCEENDWPYCDNHEITIPARGIFPCVVNMQFEDETEAVAFKLRWS